MKVLSDGTKEAVLLFSRGESYPEVLINFLKKKKIRGGFFFGLGGLRDPEISFYNLKRKKYLPKKLKGDFEVLTLAGNVSMLDNKIIVHEHVYLSGRNYKAVGGHLIKARIGGTLEIFFSKSKNLKRKFDKKTGLNLLT